MQPLDQGVPRTNNYSSGADDVLDVWRGRQEGLGALEHLSAFYRLTPRSPDDEVLLSLRGARSVELFAGVTVADLQNPAYLTQMVLDLHGEYHDRLRRFPLKDSSSSTYVRSLTIETPTDVLTLSTRTSAHMWHAAADLYVLESDDASALPLLVHLVGEVVENRSILAGRDVTHH